MAIYSGRPDLPPLTSLRFFAAVFIMLTHLGLGSLYQPFGLSIITAVLGMPLFFTLSGFIIHYVYSADFARGWAPALRGFAVARFSRLYPLFIFLFAYFAVWSSLWVIASEPAVLVSYLTLTASWWYWQIDGKAILSLPYGWSWSIATEWLFYIAYAAGLYRLGRLKSARATGVALLALCMLALAALCIVGVTGEAWEAWAGRVLPGVITRAQDASRYSANSFFVWFTYVSPYCHLFSFVGGVLTAQLYFQLKTAGVRRATNELMFWGGTAWVLVACAVFSDANAETLGRLFFLRNNFLLAPGYYLIILGLALGRCAAARPLSGSIITYGGEISYSLYLGATAFAGHIAALPANFPSVYFGLALQVLAGCILASGLHTVVEVPAKRWLRTLFAARPPLARTAARFAGSGATVMAHRTDESELKKQMANSK